MHSKCIGLCPRRFESYRQRLAFLCLEAAARRAARHCCRVSCCRRLVVSVRRIFRVGGPAQLEEYLRRFSPFVYVSHPMINPDDTVPEWLRGQTRNLLGSARASSSLVSVALPTAPSFGRRSSGSSRGGARTQSSSTSSRRKGRSATDKRFVAKRPMTSSPAPKVSLAEALSMATGIALEDDAPPPQRTAPGDGWEDVTPSSPPRSASPPADCWGRITADLRTVNKLAVPFLSEISPPRKVAILTPLLNAL